MGARLNRQLDRSCFWVVYVAVCNFPLLIFIVYSSEDFTTVKHGCYCCYYLVYVTKIFACFRTVRFCNGRRVFSEVGTEIIHVTSMNLMLRNVKVGHCLFISSSILFTYLLRSNLTTFCKLGRRNCYIARHHDKMEPIHFVWTSLVFALSVLFHVWHSS